MTAAEVANLVNEISGLKLEGSWSFGKRPYSHADPPPAVSSPIISSDTCLSLNLGLDQPASRHLKQIYTSDATAAIVGAGGDYQRDRAVSDVDDPDLGAAALEDTATGGVSEAGGSKEGGIETWPDDDEEE